MAKAKSSRSTGRSGGAGSSLLSGLIGGERGGESGITGSIRSLAGQMMDFAGAAMVLALLVGGQRSHRGRRWGLVLRRGAGGVGGFGGGSHRRKWDEWE